MSFRPRELRIGMPVFHRALKSADLSSFPPLSQLSFVLDQALWMMWVLQDHFHHDPKMNAFDISDSLEVLGVAADELSISRALARAGKRVKRTVLDDSPPQTLYRLMEAGKLYLGKKFATGQSVRVVLLDGTKPWTDRNETFPKLARSLTGRVCVVDPYYGSATLGTIRHLAHGSPLQVLSSRTNDNPAVFRREFMDFRREFPSTEIRVLPPGKELHDRYVLGHSALLLVGHGVKDLGAKESLAVLLKDPAGQEIRRTLQERFDERWKRAQPIS